jgi:hypothetical protein
MEIKQNTLYLTTTGNYVARDHLTLRIEAERELKLAVPIHHLESICVFGQNSFSPAALELCWKHGVAVNYFSENGYKDAGKECLRRALACDARSIVWRIRRKDARELLAVLWRARFRIHA